MTFRVRFVAGVPWLALCAVHAQTLDVTPSRAMLDQSVSIRATGLQPNERVAIRSELIAGDDAHWNAQAEFVAGSDGTIDTARQAPVAGSYKIVSAPGLIWSMMPASHKTEQYRPPRDQPFQTIEFHLMRGSTQLAEARLEQVPFREGIERIALHEDELRGMLFLPPGNERRPGVLVLGGSEGGLPTLRAAWLASHGYAALALAYFRYDDLPRDLAGIPLEYFGHALNWMAHRPEIRADRIAVMGTSRGGELALQVASMFKGVEAVVAYVPANVRYPACCGFTPVPFAWTWKGNGLAYQPLRRRIGQEVMEIHAVIEVEHTQGPILLISGEEDHVWSSASMADSVVSRLKRLRFPYMVENLKYAHAGHRAGLPEIVPAWEGAIRNPTSGRDVNAGGTPQGNAESSLDAIPKVLEFLEQALVR